MELLLVRRVLCSAKIIYRHLFIAQAAQANLRGVGCQYVLSVIVYCTNLFRENL